MKHYLTLSFIFVIVCLLIIFFTANSFAAWQEPNCAPPGCNRPQPITREGGSIVSGNLNLSQDVDLLTPDITLRNNFISLQGASNKIYVQAGDVGAYGYGIYSTAQIINTAAGTDNTVGIWGQAATDNDYGASYGVMGTATGTQRIAVYGYATDDGYGIYGQNMGNTSGYAGYFLGNTKINLRRPTTGNNDSFIIKSYWEGSGQNIDVLKVEKTTTANLDKVVIEGELCLNGNCVSTINGGSQLLGSANIIIEDVGGGIGAITTNSTLTNIARINGAVGGQLILDGDNDLGVLIYDELEVDGHMLVRGNVSTDTPIANDHAATKEYVDLVADAALSNGKAISCQVICNGTCPLAPAGYSLSQSTGSSGVGTRYYGAAGRCAKPTTNDNISTGTETMCCYFSDSTTSTLAEGTTCTQDSDCANGTCVSIYTDNDRDNYGSGLIGKYCYATAPPTGLALNGSDCYDSNANAHPGQSGYFENDRGDGSFDFDCDGGIEPEPTFSICSSAATYGQLYYQTSSSCNKWITAYSCTSTTNFSPSSSDCGDAVYRSSGSIGYGIYTNSSCSGSTVIWANDDNVGCR